MILLIWKPYSATTIITNKREKIMMKGMLNLQLSLRKILHPQKMLQRPTQLRSLSTIALVEEEIRTLLLEKLKVPTNSCKKEKKNSIAGGGEQFLRK
jgi:hypothetical protein